MKFNEAIDEIRLRISILDLVSERVQLKRSGKSYKGLCPFHVEKTPSFFVDPDKGVYHCFGCGASGNLFTFVMQTEGLNFREAVESLAQRLGITIEYGRGEDQRTPLLRILDFARIYYHKQLRQPQAKPVLEYLRQRGIQNATIETFQLGYAPPSGLDLLKEADKQGFGRDLLQQAGLLMTTSDGRQYDLFRNRLLFPIFDTLDRCVGFGGRALQEDQQPKYLNSPETLVFKKGRLLYGYSQARDQIRKEDRVFVVEGYMDVILMHQVGIRNTVAPLGTAFTETQAVALTRNTNRIVLVFDGDEAGKKAAKRTIPLVLKAGGFPEVVLLPEGTDPADLAVSDPEALKRYLEQPIGVIDFYLQEEAPDVRARNQQLRELAEALAHAQDPTLQEAYLSEVQEKYGYDRSRIEAAMEQAQQGSVQSGAKAPTSPPSLHWELKLVALALTLSETTEEIRQLNPEVFQNPEAARVVKLLRNGVPKEQILAESSDGFRQLVVRWQIQAEQVPADQLIRWVKEKIRKKRLHTRVKTGPAESEEDTFLKEIEELKSQVLGLKKENPTNL